MALTKVSLLIALAAFSISNAFNTLTPWDKEVVYNWRALVKAGTHFPVSYASQFVLHGKLHLQSNNNATHVKITDLSYKLYNGILDHVHEHEAHSVPLPHEVEDLQHVFKIIYDSHGLVVGIVTEGQEHEFSRNMKKAVASILQLHNSVVKKVQSPYAFVIQEHSIYGQSDVDYNIIPHHDEVVEVHKLHDMHNSHHLYQYFFTNTESQYCDAHYEEPIMHDSQKKYIIVKQDGHHIVKHIETNGAILYYPFRAQSDSQYILVNQSFELIQVVPVQQQFQVQSEHFEAHLTYHPFEENVQVEHAPDITNGRHVVNYEKLIPTVQQILKNIPTYLQADHIHTREPDTKNGQAINRVQRLLLYFNLEKLQELHKTLSGEVLDVFHHLLPLVGTKASALFIKHLIVSKAVSDEVAVELLQHLPEHILVPTVDLLTELEQLIHLDEKIHWNVRKIAILSFASLIRKSHRHSKTISQNQQHNKFHDHSNPFKVDNYELQQPYEKYVVEYINKVKTSHDYKVKMTYTMALLNMELHSTIKHMATVFTGEGWDNEHLRLLGLWAVSSAVQTEPDPNLIIETYWPVFTNRDELTELRIMAYYFIMESQPSPSRLTNLYWYMMTEPNEELYHFHYTYLQAAMKSNDPCRQQLRLKLAQLMKFTHPPSHGLSSAEFADYKDVNFGFSAGTQTYFINTNSSQYYVLAITSQDVNIYHEDYMFYLKIHGLQHQNVNSANILIDISRKTLPKISNTKDVHIEFIVLRHSHVVNTYYFNEHNLHELNYLLDFFAKETQSVTNNLLHISYDRYHKALIPTDLGTPALWEYLMPVVHKNNISISKEVKNKVVNIHVDNRYVNWIHYRHGLSFYNPIIDVWQGVNRYHSYDAAVPLHLDITLNTQQQSLQLSWKKHHDMELDVSGLRSHVKQLVFIKDDYNRNILVQSSPHSKEWLIVSRGKEYRNDFTLIDEDDLNTGHKWHLGVYDSGRHVSNGSFQHAMQLFTQPFTKQFNTPLSHMLLSYANWQRYMLLLPKPGVYGFIVRIEPSHEHTVSNIDLSIRLNSETVNDNYFYTPASKWSTRFTYAVKNKEQSLKTWDVNAIVDTNAGHTVNNLKMHLTRLVPGQKDYKVCVEGVKKWTQKGVTGHLNVAMSQSADGKCVKDDTVIDVTMTGQRSHEQDQEHHIYGACHYTIPYSVPHYHTLHCLAAHTSVRQYVYNVKTTNVPTEFRKTFAQWWDYLKGHYMSYYSYEDEHNDNIGDHNLKVDVVYPMQEHEVDVHITTPQHVYKLTGVPSNYWRWFGVRPDSTVYSPWFLFLHSSGWVDHCVVHPDHHHLNQHYIHEVVPNDWTLYVGDVAQNPQKAVYVKHITDDKIAVKAVDHGHIVEIVPHGDGHQISLDGHVISDQAQHEEDWISYHIFTNDVNHPVAVMLPQSGIHLEYDGHHVVVLVPKVEQELHGHCYNQH